ncbi:hypothetical protein RHGRI_009272 [Rhododendron griersonianum]|uniref:CCT domain-containing protein n=1 Tax=Rhododendron griersonianum TaxID=479676 RepID=A0AAV6L4I6_9ERIC|nr:hypothetical protein RHGRI_009272 [Rhododendron griersonianum]
MSSCLTGGCRPYGFDLEIVVKSPSSSSTITTHSSSPSSTTLSESSNSPLAISTRKPRTPRKRPNQTYNEAAALLSTAYPKIFPAKHLTKNSKFNTKTVLDTFLTSADSPDLLLPFRVFDNSGFLLHQPIQEKPGFRIEPRVANCYENPCQVPVENDFLEDFDAESILDEEIEEGGLDGILGNLSVENDPVDESNGGSCSVQIGSSCYGFPMGLGFGGKFDFRFGMKRGVRALRNVDEGGDWWRFPTVNVTDISPKLNKAAAPTEKKKKKIEKPTEVIKGVESPKEKSIPRENDNSIAKQKENTIPKSKILKLNYDEVANAWSDRGSPFSEEFPGQEQPGSDLHARLGEIDLFSENGGVREASVLRYKEKRRTRLFSKKIRYQVRKVNADRRPRMKGRFVRRPNSPMSDGG